MTTAYVAWNGQSYPWPPPEGWYEASDGQWWAPGTGPEPRPTVDPTRTVVASPPNRPAPTPVLTDGTPAADIGSPGPLPTITAADEDTPERSDRRAPVLVAAFVAVAIVAALGAVLALAGSDDASDLGEEATAPPVVSPGTDPPGPTATTAAAPAQQTEILRFRELLAEHGFDSELLSDADVRDFGNAFCVFAAVADDGTTFAEFRARTVAERDPGDADVNSDLSAADMARTVDVAVVAFCPEEAQRLGLTS